MSTAWAMCEPALCTGCGQMKTHSRRDNRHKELDIGNKQRSKELTP
jgi:hypothetical protein